jgi:L-lactate utilization protein LutC
VERQAFLKRLRVRLSPVEREHTASGAPGLMPSHQGAVSSECRDRFVDRLGELGVAVGVVASREDACVAVERLVGERGWEEVACAPSLKWEGIAERWTVEPREASFGLGAADWAVAETGTVVVRSSAEVRRGYSLLPPAIGFFVPRRCIRQAMGDVLRELSADASTLPSCVSFISGPSSTADLASVHVVGVHGPGEVFVWVIDEVGDGSPGALLAE